MERNQQPAPLPPIKRFKEFAGDMAWAFEELPSKESPEYWDKVIHLQDGVREELGQLSLARRGGIIWRIGIMFKMEIGRGKEPFKLTILPLTQSRDDYIRFKLYRLFDGLPSHTIQRCPGCEKYFLNITLRRKRFCSPKCMWRVNAEKRRKADPEAYRKYQKEVMADKYRFQKGLRLKKFYKSKKRKEG